MYSIAAEVFTQSKCRGALHVPPKVRRGTTTPANLTVAIRILHLMGITIGIPVIVLHGIPAQNNCPPGAILWYPII